MSKLIIAVGIVSAMSCAHAAPAASLQVSSFDITATSLPAHYKGAPCRPVASTISSAKLSKDEFESDDQNRARVTAFRAKSKLPGLVPDTLVGFVTPVKPEMATYDAENRKLIVSFTNEMLGSFSAKAASAGFTADTKMVSERKYQASNAYGASVQVKSRYGSSCAVGFLNLPYDPLASATKIDIELAPAQARLAKSGLAFLYIGTIEAPFIEKFQMYSKPTIHNPSEFALDGNTLMLSVRQIWLFDQATGQIFSRIKVPEDARP